MQEQIEFFNNLRQTFCSCQKCQKTYRLSDSILYRDKRPNQTWLDKLDREIASLEEKELAIKAKIAKAKHEAILQGRLDADSYIEQFDTLFKPLGLNPNDAKVHFHPVDYIVFNGMNDNFNPKVKNIVLLDRKENDSIVQESIRECVHDEKYGFISVRIKTDGEVVEE